MNVGNLTTVTFVIEVTVFTFLLFHRKKLARNNLSMLIPIITISIFLNFSLALIGQNKFFTPYDTLELLAVIVGTRYLVALRSKKIELILLIVLFGLITDIMQGIYQKYGWYNVHFSNLNTLVGGMLFNIFFYNILAAGNRSSVLFQLASFIFYIILFVDYFFNKTPTTSVNIISVLLVNLQNILLCGILIGTVVNKPTKTILLYEPHFWLFTGVLFNGLITSVGESLHSYIVANKSIYGQFFFIYTLEDYARYFQDCCIFFSFILCIKNYDRKTPVT